MCFYILQRSQLESQRRSQSCGLRCITGGDVILGNKHVFLDVVSTSLAVWVPPPRNAPVVSGRESRGTASRGFLSACWLLDVQRTM